MSDFFYRTLSRMTGYIMIGILFGLYALSASIEIKDLDLWLHLKTGKYIIENGYVPQVDVLSCSFAGKPWSDHEWLFQVVTYAIVNLWGFEGLISMQVAVVVATVMILLFLGYQPQRQLLIAFILLQVLFNYQMRFTIRPDIFSLLFFALYMQILSTKLHQRWSLPALFFIQVLWANMHGFFFFGPLFVSVAVVAEFLKRHVPLPYQWNETGRLTDDEYKRLQGIWFVVLAACLMNPYFVEGAIYPIKILTDISGDTKTFFKHIVELQRPVTSWNDLWQSTEYIHYKILIAVSFLSFIFNRRKMDVSALLVWLVFLVFSLMAVRNLVFFSFAAYLVIMANAVNVRLDDILPLRFTLEKFKHITSIMLKLALCFWMINYSTKILDNGYFDYDTFERKSEFGGISKRNYPYRAVDFLVQNNIKGNFFNDFNSGAYLIGRAFPNIKPFMDGRTELRGGDFFNNQYLKIWRDGDEKIFDELAEQYQMTGAFLNSNSHQLSDKLVSLFENKKDWIPVYFDYDALIYLKDVPEHKELIERFKIDFDQWQPPPFDLQKLGTRPISPRHQINRAYTLVNLLRYDLALAEVEMASKIAPQDGEIYKLRGKIFDAQKLYQEAFENYRIATSMWPGDVDLRGKLGLAYEQLGDIKGAIKQFQRVVDTNPRDARGLYNLARCLAQDGQIDNAREMLRKAIVLEPGNSVELLKIGDIMFEKNEVERAKVIYSKALFGNSDLANVHYKIGKACLALGQRDEARMHFEKGLAVDAEHDDLKAAVQEFDAGVASQQ